MGANVTYLIGAGASYGERGPKGVSFVKRGIPIVNEMEWGIEYVITNLIARPQTKSIKVLVDNMRELQQHCVEYPTIDTYAKMLYTTKRNIEYERLKKQLSIYFLLVQHPSRRDIRYDGFIASLMDETNGKLPNINVLSWNYDAQFEMAIADYVPHRYNLLSITTFLNERNKSFAMNPFFNDDRFTLIKLNGTAFFEQTKAGGILQEGNYRGDYWDDIPEDSKLEIFADFLTTHPDDIKGSYECRLSYAWEHYLDTEDAFYEDIQNKLIQTHTLVVIGYSFPYVNRLVDKRLFKFMPQLQTIYIQDGNFLEIEERLKAITNLVYEKPFTHENIHGTDKCSQFLIPNEFA